MRNQPLLRTISAREVWGLYYQPFHISFCLLILWENPFVTYFNKERKITLHRSWREGEGQGEEKISSFVDNFSGLWPFKGKHAEFDKVVSLVIWLSLQPLFSIPTCLCTPLFHVEETVILELFMQIKGFLVSLLILKTWDKHIVKLSGLKKSLFYKKQISCHSTLAFGKWPFSQSDDRMVISIIPCAMYSIIFREGRKADTYLHFTLFFK